MIDVAAAIIFSGDRFLIARRAPHKDQAGFWEFPGGKLEANEEPSECLIREISEELSLKICVVNHLTDNVFAYPDKTINLKAYICKLLDGEPHLTDHDRIEWILPSSLDDYHFAPADVAVVNVLKTYLYNISAKSTTD